MKNEKSVTLTAKEAAEYLGISYWLLTEQAKRGAIPHAKIGGKLVFRKKSLDQFLDEQEANSLKTSVVEGENYYGKRKH